MTTPTCCNCCIWRCCSSALPQSQWASGPFWSARLPLKLCKLYFLFVLTTFCQTSAVHNLQCLVQVQFKVSLNPWNPQKNAGLKVLEMIPRFAATLGDPPNGAPSTLLPESSVQTCLLYPFVVIWRTSCGVSNSFIFFSQRHCKPKVTASRPSDATMSPKTSVQKDPKEHAVHVKRQRPGWFGWRALHFSWPWEPTSGLCTINKNWSMGIVASSPGNASIGHLQPSTGDRISRHLALLVWKLHLLLGIAAKKWIPNWVKCLSVWDDSRVDEPAKWIMEKEHGSWVKLAFCLHVLACVDLLTIFPTISQELNLPLVGPKLLPHFGSAYRLGTLFSHMPTNTHSERHRPLSGPKPNRGSRSTRTERLE